MLWHFMSVKAAAKALLGTSVVSAVVAVAAGLSDSTVLALGAVATSFITSLAAVATVWINRGVRGEVAKVAQGSEATHVKLDTLVEKSEVIRQDVNSGKSAMEAALARANEIITEQAAALATMQTEKTERAAAGREADVAKRETEVARHETPPTEGA